MSLQSRPTAMANENGNLFEIRTVQSSAFRTLIEALKEILTEANLEFDSTGIKVIDVDETHTVLTYLRLYSERFEYFYCPVKYVLGINMIYLFKLIKTLSNNEKEFQKNAKHLYKIASRFNSISVIDLI